MTAIVIPTHARNKEKNMRKITSFLLCVLLVLTSTVFVGCDAEPKMSGPEKALEEFEKAFNERDLDGIVKIFKPSVIIFSVTICSR